jgi:hypothetical protein
MKKLLLLVLLSSSLILVGCSQKWLSQSELFEKKQECSKYANYEEQWTYEIFYSEKANSCIYTIQETVKWWIYDALTQSILYESESPLKCSYMESEEKCNKIERDFEQKVKELKWE